MSNQIMAQWILFFFGCALLAYPQHQEFQYTRLLNFVAVLFMAPILYRVILLAVFG
jgi:isoprenylcysteine carboxyl methyltransferase (ICMT) family protein YpbQ